MARWQRGVVGNPSGSHKAARDARRAVEEARDEVASFLGAKPGGVIFTGGGTESCALAVFGVTSHHRRTHENSEILISRIEHHAVSDAAEKMARDFDDVRVRYIDVDSDGVVDLDSLMSHLSDDTALVSVMAANNETGVRQPLDGVSALSKSIIPGGVLTHSDAIAAASGVHLANMTATIDMISICAHKIGGPVNSGALILRSDIALDALIPGGGQERGRRGGTVDVAAAVGLAAAVRVTIGGRELFEWRREPQPRVGRDGRVARARTRVTSTLDGGRDDRSGRRCRHRHTGERGLPIARRGITGPATGRLGR
jgi:cysteine desulfurase